MTAQPKPKRSIGRSSHAWRLARAKVLSAAQICSWCRMPIDRQLRYPDPMAAVCDHIIDMCDGGPKVDTRNLQALHGKCNAEKEVARRSGITVRPTNPSSRDW